MTTSRALSIVPEPEPRPVKLSFRGVGKSFTTGTGTEVAVLDDVTFDVRAGEFVCLIGPSGCGKSTILNLLAGLDTPSAGTVWSGPMPARLRWMVARSSSPDPIVRCSSRTRRSSPGSACERTSSTRSG